MGSHPGFPGARPYRGDEPDERVELRQAVERLVTWRAILRSRGRALRASERRVRDRRHNLLEVVSPARPDTAAGRLLERRGGDCGYMLMFQVSDLGAARARAAERGIREVFEVDLADISEVHLHPGDMAGAIVSLSAPQPASSWRWGGPDWEARSVCGGVAGATIAVADPDAVEDRWRAVIGDLDGVRFVADERSRGPVEVLIEDGSPPGLDAEIGGVRFVRA